MTQAELVMLISITMGLIAYSLVARWFVMPALSRLPREDALTPLILPHAFRYIGLGFLVSGVVAPDIDPRFALPAAWGDLLAAALALLTVLALRARWSVAVPLAWTFSVVGIVDLLNAVTTGLRTVDNGQFGGVYFVPTLVVPALLVTHVMVVRILLQPRTAAAA